MLTTINVWITYTLVEKESVTGNIIRHLSTESILFHFLNPLNFNPILSTFILLFLMIFLISQEYYRKDLIRTIRTFPKLIMLLALLHLTANYAYQYSYELTEKNKLILVLSDLGVPATLIISGLLLNEKITKIKIISIILIKIGSIIKVF